MKIRLCDLLLISLALVLPLACNHKPSGKIPGNVDAPAVTNVAIKPPVMSHFEFNASTRELMVFYSNGDRVGFRDVPWDVYRGLITAGSREAFFGSEIKGVYTEFSPPARAESGVRQTTK